jgi:hypothetical protein
MPGGQLAGADIVEENFMSRVERIEGQVKALHPEELAAFREWFSAFDAEAWDRQFEADVIAGKLDGMAERALRDHTAGRPTKL